MPLPEYQHSPVVGDDTDGIDAAGQDYRRRIAHQRGINKRRQGAYTPPYCPIGKARIRLARQLGDYHAQGRR